MLQTPVVQEVQVGDHQYVCSKLWRNDMVTGYTKPWVTMIMLAKNPRHEQVPWWYFSWCMGVS